MLDINEWHVAYLTDTFLYCQKITSYPWTFSGNSGGNPPKNITLTFRDAMRFVSTWTSRKMYIEMDGDIFEVPDFASLMGAYYPFGISLRFEAET